MFAIDPRSLAVFRISIGLLLLVDLAIRAADLEAMYSDVGMFPRGKISFHFPSIWSWSFHFASGSSGFEAILYGLAGCLGLALAAGWQTRLTTIGSWLMLLSLHHRVPPILSGADTLLRMLLFWGMFLPLERVWSLDWWLAHRRRAEAPVEGFQPVLSVASVAILVQMALMYLCSAVFKTNHAWLSGQAVAGILANNFFASRLGTSLLSFSRLLAVMTWGTLALEWVALFVLFFPKWTGRVRLGAVAALVVMHLCIAALMEVDFFSPVAMAGLTLFLPAEFWNSRLFTKKPNEIQIPAKPARQQELARPAWAGLSAYLPQGACLVALLYVLAVNFNGLPGLNAPLGLGESTFLWTGCGLGQRWAMFDAAPPKNGWYVAWAKLRDGSRVDLLRHGAKLDWRKPVFPAGEYPNARWRKCFREMSYDDELGYQVFREPVAEYLCHAWNANHGPEQQLTEFELVFCNEPAASPNRAADLQFAARERLVHLEFNALEREDEPVSGL